MPILRALTISHLFPSKEQSSSGIFICRQAENLRKHNIECSFLVGRPWAPWPLYRLDRWKNYAPSNSLAPPYEEHAELLSYLRLPGLYYRRYEGTSLATSVLKRAREWHASNPFDLILGISMFPDAEAAVFLSEKLSLPVATIAIGSDVMLYPNRQPLIKKKLADILRKVDLPIGVSKAICQTLSSTNACKRDPICIYLSRDENAFKPAPDRHALRQKLGLPENNVIASYVGRLEANKGFNELLQAAKELLTTHPNFTLLCAGDGPLHHNAVSIKNIIQRRHAIHLTGHVNPEIIPEVLQASDFFVFPSYSEGMPQAVLEAMNCGLPVLATDVGGISEAVIPNRTGLLVQPKNILELRSALQRMLTDEAFRNRAAKYGLQRVLTIFGSSHNTEKLASALISLTKK